MIYENIYFENHIKINFYMIILNSCRDELLSQLFENWGNYLKIWLFYCIIIFYLKVNFLYL